MLHSVSSTQKHEHHHHVTAEIKGDPWVRYTLIVIALLLLLLFLHGHGWAQGSSAPGQDVYDRTNKALKVNVVAGGGTGGGPSDTAASAAASESDTARQKVTSAIRVLDTGQAAGSQLVTAKGDQTSGMWVNCKAGCSAAGDTVGGSQTFTAAAQTATVTLAGGNGASLMLTSAASPLLTLVPEVSNDGGTNWHTAVFLDPVSGALSTSLVNPANGTYQIAWVGFETNARVRCSAFTSGSIIGQLRSGTTRPWTISGGSDGTNLRIFHLDTSGNLNVIFPSAQAVTSTQLPAALDGSGFLKTHEQGTATVSGTVTANIGTTNGLALDASVTGLQVAQASTTSGQKGDLIQGAVTTNAPSYTTAQTDPLSLDTSGLLRVSLKDTPQNTNALKVDASATTQPVSGTVTANQGTSPWVTQDNSNGATGSAVPSRAAYIGGQGSGNLTGITVCDNVATFSFSSTTNQKIIANAASKTTFICAINVVVAGAVNLALVSGTKTTNECDTSTAGLAGGTTAATGWNFAANGGLTQGSGIGWVTKTSTTAKDVCLFASAAVQVSGFLTYTQQ